LLFRGSIPGQEPITLAAGATANRLQNEFPAFKALQYGIPLYSRAHICSPAKALPWEQIKMSHL